MDPHSIGIDPHLAYFLPFFGLFALIGFVVYVIPFWMIFRKAGFSPWFSLLIFVPLANIIMLYVVAFAQWKVVPLPQYAGGYPPPAYPPAYPPTAYPPAAPPPANPGDPSLRG